MTPPTRQASDGAADAKLRLPKIAALLMAAAALSGCALATSNEPYRSSYPITVERAPEVLELAPGRGLTQSQNLEVAAFARRYQRDGAGVMTIAYPADAPAQPFVRDVVGALRRNGVAPSSIKKGPYSRETDGDRGVVAFFTVTQASADGCDNVWGETAVNLFNDKSRRLGCANRANLAAMVAEPRDLIAPRAVTPFDVARRRAVIEQYRGGEETASEGSGERVETTE